MWISPRLPLRGQVLRLCQGRHDAATGRDLRRKCRRAKDRFLGRSRRRTGLDPDHWAAGARGIKGANRSRDSAMRGLTKRDAVAVILVAVAVAAQLPPFRRST